MGYVYPAIFYKEGNGQYSVIFPDLNDLSTYGNSLEDALYMAQEACGMYIFNTLKDGEAISKPTDARDINIDEENAFVNLIYVDLDKFIKTYSDKSVKKTLSIPAWLNDEAVARNLNFSKILQEALIKKIQSQ